MLQAAFDESETQHGELRGRLFVLAGYVATVDRWQAFTGEWSEALRRFTNGEPFSMAEANRLWNAERLEEQVGYLQGLINNHAEFGFGVICDPAMLDEYLHDTPFHKVGKPHFFCVHHIVTRLLMIAEERIAGRKIDFIFDRGRTQLKEIASYWDELMEGAPPRVRELVPNEPSIRSNRDFVPIQAADMAAWWMRRIMEDRVLGLPKRSRPFRCQSLPFWPEIVTEDTLVQLLNSLPLAEPDPGMELRVGPDGVTYVVFGSGLSFGRDG